MVTTYQLLLFSERAYNEFYILYINLIINVAVKHLAIVAFDILNLAFSYM